MPQIFLFYRCTVWGEKKSPNVYHYYMLIVLQNNLFLFRDQEMSKKGTVEIQSRKSKGQDEEGAGEKERNLWSNSR